MNKKILRYVWFALLWLLSGPAFPTTTVVIPGSVAAYIFSPAATGGTGSTDTTPPTVVLGTPASITATGATFTGTLNEAGYGCYVVQLSSITQAPTVTQVRNGTNSAGTSVPSSCSNMSANTATAFTLTGLSSSTSYTIYFAARDNASPSNNWTSSVSSVTLTTLQSDTTPPNTITMSTPTVTTTTASFNATIDEAGQGYYIVQTKATAAPTVAQIAAGKNGTGVAAVASGNLAMSANTSATFNITGLTASTQYTVYFAARDNATPSNNWQTSSTSKDFTTSTPANCNQTQSGNNVGDCCSSVQSVHGSYGRATTTDYVNYKALGSGTVLASCSAAACSLQKTATNVWAVVGSCP